MPRHATKMISTTADRIVCPRCKAILLSHRKSCSQCGEPISAPDSESLGSRIKGADYFANTQSELRNIKRKRVEIWGIELSSDATMSSDILVEDLSETGCRFKGSVPHNPGDRVRVMLPLSEKNFAIAGVIRRVTRTLDSVRPYSCGMEFVLHDSELPTEINKIPSTASAE